MYVEAESDDEAQESAKLQVSACDWHHDEDTDEIECIECESL